MKPIILYRISPGFYESSEGGWTIQQGPRGYGCGWAGQWVCAKGLNEYSDPIPTFKEAKDALAEMLGRKIVVKRDPRPRCREHNALLPCQIHGCPEGEYP